MQSHLQEPEHSQGLARHRAEVYNHIMIGHHDSKLRGFATRACSWPFKVIVMKMYCWSVQEDHERSQRLRKAQQELEIDDDMIGGQQGNSLLELIKQGKLSKKQPVRKDDRASGSGRPSSAPPTNIEVIGLKSSISVACCACLLLVSIAHAHSIFR